MTHSKLHSQLNDNSAFAYNYFSSFKIIEFFISIIQKYTCVLFIITARVKFIFSECSRVYIHNICQSKFLKIFNVDPCTHFYAHI